MDYWVKVMAAKIATNLNGVPRNEDEGIKRKYKAPRVILDIKKNRQTGTFIQIDYSMNEPGYYQATCYGTDEQPCGFYVNTCTYGAIMRVGRYPLDWCPSCQGWIGDEE